MTYAVKIRADHASCVSRVSIHTYGVNLSLHLSDIASGRISVPLSAETLGEARVWRAGGMLWYRDPEELPLR